MRRHGSRRAKRGDEGGEGGSGRGLGWGGGLGEVWFAQLSLLSCSD